MNMETVANLFMAWLCVLQPLLAYGLGVLAGRHGLRQAIYLILVRVFGRPKETS